MATLPEHCPKCGCSSAIHSVLMVVLDFSNWLQLVASVAVVLFLAKYLSLSSFESGLIAFIALIAMVTSVRRKNFCERCEIEFVSGSKAAPSGKA